MNDSIDHIHHLKNLIADNKTRPAIDYLRSGALTLNEPQQKTLVLIAGRWNTLRERKLRGTISPVDAQVEHSQINESLLALIDQPAVPPPATAAAPSPAPAASSPKEVNWKNILTGIAAVIAVLAGLAELSGYSIRDLWEQSAESKEQINTQTANSQQDTVPLDTLPQQPIETVAQSAETPAVKAIPQPTTPATEQLALPKPDFSLAIKTNKGSSNLVFQQDEEVRIYFQVSRPCYLRSIYQLADGSLILLDKDQAVIDNQVNQWLELGDGFEVAAPLGTEQLFVFAQELAFPTLELEEKDGYSFIRSDLNTALRKSRGLKKKTRLLEETLTIETKE